MMFRNISIRAKMFFVIFMVVLIPMIIVSGLLYKRSEQSITEQASKVVISSINFAVDNIDTALYNVTGMSQLLLTDNRLFALAKQELPLEPEVKYARYSGILDLLSFFKNRIKASNIMEGIESFNLYLVHQNTVIDSNSTYYENIDPGNLDFIKQAQSQEGVDRWFVSRSVDYYTLNHIETRLESNKQITFDKILKNEDKTIAILAVNVNENYISDYYRKIQRGIPGDFVVLDANANVVAYSDKSILGTKTDLYTRINSQIQLLGRESGSFFYENQSQFVVYSISNYTGWRFVVVIPSSEILGKVYEMRKFFFILISVTGLLIFAVTYLLSNLFYKPLLKLVKAMHKIENGNLDIRILDNRKDEYRLIYQGFNDMADELKLLIKDLANEKVLNQEAEIKLLQAQINPHFLYNTLDSIYSIAKIKKVEEISQMVAALSKFFRYSLSGGREIVTLKEAVGLVVSYLTILNIRYKGEISFHIELPEELGDCQVPKLLLQPIVENSIYHGIEQKKGHGHITITASTNHEGLQLIIEDNGIGMKEEDLAKLSSSIALETTDDTSSFALRNLNRQIHLKYGYSYGIKIESVYGEGTKVTIGIPIVSKELLFE
ncbi:HAMP domain-containing protein [Paenibacillus sp. LMG 31460]|uniref:HAMP domain-containing protein n=1 Tax=Paenibacillus germinis TaxID=2654979 RepID=A0ABX1Z994_9BACL|nr:sensor histidine kinase [Paenibacillus germinis]NOU88400.1 HAMP domain-containing protein [Paenibacillus germinis]